MVVLPIYGITNSFTWNKLFSVIENNQTGWIVIDQNTLDDVAPNIRIEFTKNDNIEFIGLLETDNFGLVR